MIVCIPPGRGIPGGISRSATKGAPAAARTLQMGPGRGHKRRTLRPRSSN